MSFDAHKNFAYSTVATAPSPASSGTSLVVASGDGAKFPAVPFNATVWPANTQPTTANAEIVRVTAISTDTFTITRAQESSSARTVGVGDQIAATITAKSLTDIETLLPYAMNQIADTTLGVAAATIDFSSISSSYNHLLLIYSLRSAIAETTALTSLRFNGDTGSNYGRQHIWGQNTGSNVGNSGGSLISSMDMLFETGTSASANSFGRGMLLIPSYADTTKLKNALALHAMFGSTSSTANWFAGMTAGLWNSTSAINRITIYASDLSSNLAAGSRATLYGLT